MTKDQYIPQYLDEPERYLFFTPDEAIAAVFPLVIVGVLSSYPYGLACAIAALLTLRKFKEGGPLSRLLWRAYWILPEGVIKLKATPPSYLRCLAG